MTKILWNVADAASIRDDGTITAKAWLLTDLDLPYAPAKVVTELTAMTGRQRFLIVCCAMTAMFEGFEPRTSAYSATTDLLAAITTAEMKAPDGLLKGSKSRHEDWHFTYAPDFNLQSPEYSVAVADFHRLTGIKLEALRCMPGDHKNPADYTLTHCMSGDEMADPWGGQRAKAA